ncbi:diguanylate cyclase [Actinotalea sp. BY-33]|uniref:Diguanylate cyclase n=1 Tax=Actinotalea soli TaxID=2819234 RepID=A0A939LTG7_9CELL|nr:GGDEF domain-containing protein [Actinotalea soli]MBO1751819.1 diguanylate cyclase [Actinotalea soli]
MTTSPAPGCPATTTSTDDVRSAAELDRVLAQIEETRGVLVEGSLDEVAQIERRAEDLGDVELQWRARLVRADILERQGQLDEAAKLLWQANEFALSHGRRRLLARSHFLLARTHRDLGDMPSYLEHTVDAVENLADEDPAALRALYVTRLADALAESGSLDAARVRYRQAEDIAVDAGDSTRRVLTLNNLAYVEYLNGEPERAQVAMDRLRRICTEEGIPLDAHTLDTIACIELALGRHADAKHSARASIEVHRSVDVPEVSGLPELLLTLAVAQRHLGEHAAAQESLDEARSLCEQHGLASARVQVDEQQAELFAATGRFEEAFEAHKAFHRAERALMSQQREAQARVRQAMFETSEARQQADQFRDQARRDPLTGLYNRRYVNESLPSLLAGGTGEDVPIVAALLDLDHFKRVNDTRSHQTGDEVLEVVARIFSATVTELVSSSASTNAFAARMGGEEFLVVLTGLPPRDAQVHLERLRRRVAEHDWEPLTGDLPVTVSIGVAVAGRDTQSTLLRRADDALYEAKRAGRNTVRRAD